jgi:lysozyme
MSNIGWSRFHSTRRTVGVASAGLLLALSVPAAAVHAAPKQSTADNHAMGSQIRIHEKSGSTARTPMAQAAVGGIKGIDVSSWQGTVDWSAQWSAGKRFAWVKATEGTNYASPTFSAQYNGAYKQGFIRGAYHFALPNKSSGAAQAKYFSNHGGGWSGDGKTLPGVLDMEYNPYGGDCYGMSKSKMKSWISSFSNYYKSRWDKYPVIYTSTSWWKKCVNSSFSKTNALWVARYGSSVGTLPYNWAYYTIWQYSDSPIDQDSFNGSAAQLKKFATNHD